MSKSIKNGGKSCQLMYDFSFSPEYLQLKWFFGVNESKSGKSFQEKVLFLWPPSFSFTMFYIFNCDIFIKKIIFLDYSQPGFVIKLDQLERKVYHLETLLHQYTGGRGIYSLKIIFFPGKIPPLYLQNAISSVVLKILENF